MTNHRGGLFRTVGMSLVVVAIIALSLGNTGWAQIARAQTVPTLTFTPAPTLAGSPRPTAIFPSATPGVPPGASSATPSPKATPVTATSSPSGAFATPGTPIATVSPNLAVCGPSPFVLAVQVRNTPVQLVTSVGTLTLLGSDGLIDLSAAAVIVSRFSVQIVPKDQMPAAPTGWRVPGCGLQATAAAASGQIATFLRRGLMACQALPKDSASTDPWRLAYFDARPEIRRWVFVPGHHSAGQLCSDRFHIPAIFALLTSAT